MAGRDVIGLVLLFSVGLFTNLSTAAESLILVRDGRPASLIVTNGRPSLGQQIAAAELQEHLRIMSGATLPIVKESDLPADSSQTLILIGQGNLTSKVHGVVTKHLEPETFIVRTSANALILAGEDGGNSRDQRTGTLWAVYDFLQDQLGCRWIWPGETGRYVPRRETIRVSDLNVVETPQIKVRSIRLLAQDKHRVGYEKEGLGRWLDLGKTYDQISEDERVWTRRMRMGRSFRLSYGHAFTDWWETYHRSDPDVFAMQPDGKRRPRKTKQPDFVKMCVSNPRLWELQLDPLEKAAAKGSRGLWLNACENDGSGGFCVCSRCRAWDATPNARLDALPQVEDGSEIDGPEIDRVLPESLSDRYGRWFNELAVRAKAADPEARLVAYAYGRYRAPPTKLQHIEPNVWIGYIGFNAYPRPEAYRKMSTEEWFGWSRLGSTVFLRSNSLFYLGEGAPYVASQQVAEDLRFQIDNGLRATDYDALQGYWAATGPTYYVLARMLWDTQADVDRLLDEFYESFGPMKQVVKEYYDGWETRTVALGNNEKFFQLKRAERIRAYPLIYSQSLLDGAAAVLARGTPLLASATEAQRERFENVRLGLEHARLMVAALEDGKTSTGPAGEKLMQFRRRIADRNVLNVYWTISKEMRYRVFD
ncbi:hypothetical protein EC9_45790 [Rosistilla ulvae]|uniref:Alpha glucuronidase N-terminal domain-containing protein n=1 Tax=Rosistilla ulvae TaxID=1930277 RepID=A0A517M668_9BACT|nr:DUF4838 domain-containing protein [Rosistilla ulvae]QDS90371.1 hypothetical protein EC9_45790 [Rosistilla ulvae]